MSLTGSRTLIRRSAEQWRGDSTAFRAERADPGSVLRRRGTGLEHFTLWRRKLDSSRNMITNNDAAMFVALPTVTSQARRYPTTLWDVELQLGADVVLRLRHGESC